MRKRIKKRMGAWLLAIGFVTALFPMGAGAAAPASLSSLSAVLYEPTTGTVLYEKDAHTSRAMASTTKLMTALLAAESGDLARDVEATAAAVAVEGSALGLRAGDKISMEDLITGLLLASGNDAANTIALTVDDSLEAFAGRMNARAAEIGMKESHFVTPSGLDGDGHAASAYDMALLGAEVLKNPVLARICATKTAEIEMGNPKHKVTVSNHNKLLRLYGDAIGMKTGFTKKSGKCLVSAASRDGVTLIAVTLNGGDYWNDHISLYEYGFSLLEAVTPEAPALPEMPVAGGETSRLRLTAAAPAPMILAKGKGEQLTVTISLPSFLLAPVQPGQRVGEICYALDGEVLQRIPIEAEYKIAARPVAGFAERFREYIGLLLRGLLC